MPVTISGRPNVGISDSELLTQMANCHPQNCKTYTAGASCAAAATLLGGGTYHVYVDEATVGTPVAVYMSLVGNFDSDGTVIALMVTSSMCPFYLAPQTDCTLYLKRVGGSNVTVKVAGLNSTSTVTNA